MKRYFNFMLFVPLLLLAVAGCKKNESQVFLEGGNAPVLTSSVSGITLNPANKDAEAANFSWTNPDYSFSTGVSSHDVSYTIQIDTAGANFSNPQRQEFSVNKELSRSLLIGELNNSLTSLTKLALVSDMPHNIEVRVVASINGAAPLISNVLKFSGVVPYEDFAVAPPVSGELYITGDATNEGWVNTPSGNQKLTKISKGEFDIVMNFVPGKYYKFLSDQAKWQPQYGGTSATGGGIAVNLGNSTDPSAIPTPDVAGTYKVDINFKTGQYTVTKQ